MSTIDVTPGVLEQLIENGIVADPRAAEPVGAATAAWLSAEWSGFPYYDNYLVLRWNDAASPGASDYAALYDKPPTDPWGYLTNQWAWAENHRDGRFVTGTRADGSARWIAYVHGPRNRYRIGATAYVGDGLAGTDANAACGFYDIKGGSSSDQPAETGGILQHAFAVLFADGGERVEFGCYGGTDRNPGKNLVYPADFRPPYIADLNPPPLGKSLRSTLRVARGMAQFSLNPEVRDSYNRTSGGYLNRGDCSGLLYGVQGVCHQMCNRVLWAGSRNLGFTYTPVNFPPSMRVSHPLYGFWGVSDTMPAAVRLATELARGGRPVSLSDAELEEMGIEGLRLHLERGYGREARALLVDRVMDGMLGADFSETYAITHQEGILEADLELHRRKRDLDVALLQGTMPNAEYVRELNAEVSVLMARYADVLRPADFRTAFAAEPAEVQQTAVVAEELMPAHDPSLAARAGL
jgi:hypothetical protein